MQISLLQQFCFLSLISISISQTNFSHAYNQCQDGQKELLIQLKNDLIFNSSASTKLVQWNQTGDCCRWDGVGCDASGHVTSLQLDYEGISGGIESSSSLVSLEYLEKLSLAHNSLEGSIPSLNLSKLVELDLSSNQLKGPISNSFFLNLESLEALSLSHNLFNATLDLQNTQTLSKLKKLSLSSCNLHKVPDFVKQSNLNFLDLSENRIGGAIPSWIWEIGKGGLYHLNLSYNLLDDIQKPYTIPMFLAELDLHSNQLRGELPLLPLVASYIDFSDNNFDKNIPLDLISFSSNLIFLSIANNSISGSIPTCICSGESIQVLDLSMNNMSGSIPPCIVERIPSLQMLNLRMNNISGEIPDRFPTNCGMRILDLNTNNLVRDFPKSLQHCTSLWFVNVGENMIGGSFPCMLPLGLRVLVLHSNKFDGEVKCRDSYAHNVVRPDFHYLSMLLYWIFSEFLVLDFSCNGFQGEIPEAIGDLSSLRLLNLSHNALTGRIPRSFGNMAVLEALDLSADQLAETIPAELADIMYLSVLNLSNNQLVGEIPNGGQLPTFAADSFEGNRGLCGYALNVSCTTWKLSNDAAPWKVEDGVLMYLFLTFLAFL